MTKRLGVRLAAAAAAVLGLAAGDASAAHPDEALHLITD